MMMKTCSHIDPQFQTHLLEMVEHEAEPHWREELSHCIPLLLELAAESHDLPVGHLAPSIRAILAEHCRVGPAGQPVRIDDDELQRHVDLLVHHLEELRLAQLGSGSWSDVPMPPQFFG